MNAVTTASAPNIAAPTSRELAELVQSAARSGRDDIYHLASRAPIAERVTSATADARQGLATLAELMARPDLPSGTDLAPARAGFEAALATLGQLEGTPEPFDRSNPGQDPALAGARQLVLQTIDSFGQAESVVTTAFHLPRLGSFD